MVNIRRATGSRNPAEMTYYVQHDGVPLPGTSAAKVLNTVDSQTMALTLGYFVQLQAERKHEVERHRQWKNRASCCCGLEDSKKVGIQYQPVKRCSSVQGGRG